MIRLCDALEHAMTVDTPRHWDQLGHLSACDEHDELVTMLMIHDLWLEPLWVTAGRERFQTHPVVMQIKTRLETAYLHRLRLEVVEADWASEGDAVADIRRVSATELVPEVYRWLAEDASWPETVRFLAHEGGPDAGFDDLVALAQLGLRGRPKVTLGANYWDEMGRGELSEVHTVLHDDLVRATDMPRIDRRDLPSCALHRMALGGVLATNRQLQPEMIGALGLLELQAGPRCRAVLAALERLDAPAGAYPFYAEHATADPRHGKEWLDQAVRPLEAAHREWGPRMVEGARWRHHANHRFFAEILDVVAEPRALAGAGAAAS